MAQTSKWIRQSPYHKRPCSEVGKADRRRLRWLKRHAPHLQKVYGWALFRPNLKIRIEP